MIIKDTFLDDINEFSDDSLRVKKAFKESYDTNTDMYSQNIIAASFFVIFFSIFENAIKELFKSYIQYLVSTFPTKMIPDKIFLSHISATSISLKNMAKETGMLPQELLKISKNLILCSKKNQLFKPDITNICYLQNNIDFEQINELCKNVGINNFKKKIATEPNIQAYYGSHNIDYVVRRITSDFCQYKSERKHMVHSCSFRSGVGSDHVYNYIKFAKRITVNLALVLSKEILQLESINDSRSLQNTD